MKRPSEGLIDSRFDYWFAALQERHLANLRVTELTRALRALSSIYVERRHTVSRGGPFDGAGKRAAFALFYAPLHFLMTAHVVRSVGGDDPPPDTILDVGCGAGAAGAAWALAAGSVPVVRGIDRHAWAVDEARWTYRALGVRGTVQRGLVERLPHLRPGSAAVAAYVLNELPGDSRIQLERHLFSAAERGVSLLVIEPIARGIAPWWSDTARRATRLGGRADEWRMPVDLPPLLQTLDKAAGLHHRELTARSLWLPGRTA